jgi:putative addiction module CopG family antidote
MTIHLPEDLQRFVREQVESGRYPSEEDVIRDALERLRIEREPSLSKPMATAAVIDPVLGSMRDEAELMDEIVADAYRHRREETWRDIDL